MSDKVRLERDELLATVTLAAPPLNLVDDDVIEGWDRAVAALEAEPPRTALFRAEGRVVSGGVDVKVFDAIAGSSEGIELWERLIGLARRVQALPFPTVFAAHALTLTAAFELSLACDLLVATEEARFGLVERVVGLTPAMGGTQRLAERAGPARAREFVYTGGLYDAATMHQWGVVNHILPAEGFDDAVLEYARHIAVGPPIAHAATKRIVRAAMDGGVDAADAITPQVAGELFDTEDLRGAVTSFLAEGPGKARFSGR